MAIYFFDSSAIFKRYVSESGSSWVISIAEPAAGNDIYQAQITGVEVVSGFMRSVQLAAAVELHNSVKGVGLPIFTFVSADHPLNTASVTEGFSVDDPTPYP